MADDFEQQAQQIFKGIWSPYCPGVSLLECPSSKAEDLREVIRVRIKNGESPTEVISALKAEYGNTLRMEPTFEGRESLAYSLPWIALALGIIIFLMFILMKRMKKAKPLPAPSRPDPEMLKKILKDLE